MQKKVYFEDQSTYGPFFMFYKFITGKKDFILVFPNFFRVRGATSFRVELRLPNFEETIG